jgi:hypothetical protein
MCVMTSGGILAAGEGPSVRRLGGRSEGGVVEAIRGFLRGIEYDGWQDRSTKEQGLARKMDGWAG